MKRRAAAIKPTLKDYYKFRLYFMKDYREYTVSGDIVFKDGQKRWRRVLGTLVWL